MARMDQACKAKNIPETYYEVRPGGVAIVFRFKDINNESNSNQNCELDCESIGGRVYVGRSAECIITSATILLERLLTIELLLSLRLKDRRVYLFRF